LEAVFEGAATHAALLPTNQVFAYGGSALDKNRFEDPPPAELLDLDSMQTRKVPMAGVDCDLFCCGHTFLPNGRLILAGGTSCYPPTPDPFYGGIRQAFLYDPFAESWQRLPDMQEGRWYPTLIRLADNTVLTFSGLQYRDPKEIVSKKGLLRLLWEAVSKIKEYLVPIHEVYDPEQGAWAALPEQGRLPLYPRLHLLPDGDVFYSGVFNTHYFTPGRYPSARWRREARRWTPEGGRHHHKNREEGISLLLALRPPDYAARVLVAGGGQHNGGRALALLLHQAGKDSWAELLSFLSTAVNSVEMIDLSEPEPRWKLKSPMNTRRIHANGVLLPDGQVLVVGGMPGHGHGHSGAPVLPAELYDPQNDRWTRLASPRRPRLYHSTALLLPDARVISMGGNPHGGVIEPYIEIFSPPYLFRGPRPALLEAPAQIPYGQTFQVRVQAARPTAQVVLMRPQVTTHVTDTDQRLLELMIRARDGETLEVMSPLDRAQMPEGYCLLFILDDDGVPSVGKFLKVC
jgi:hypothetical protein